MKNIFDVVKIYAMPLSVISQKESIPSLSSLPKTPQGNQVYIVSLGCPRNLVDTEVMLGLLLRSGYEVAQTIEEADILLVNTCGFLESARQEGIETFQTLRSRQKPDALLIATGCMVQTHRKILEDLSVDHILASADLESLLKLLEGAKIAPSLSKSYLEQGEVPRTLSTPKHYAYLKIAEGCKKRCSYCIIPEIKGPLRSKSIDRILRERDALLSSGVKEIILIAQDLGDFGKDRTKRNQSELPELLRQLVDTPQDFWLRLLYLYPDEITPELIELMEKQPKILPYLDMPIQHISDSVLKRMRRTTSSQQIKHTLEMLRQRIPDIVIRTSLMVGFPGETEQDFDELCQFIQDYPLDNVGIFMYSNEKEAPSSSLEEQVCQEVKQRRHDTLAALQATMVEKMSKKYLGKTLEVFVEGTHPESSDLLVGRSYAHCPEIDGQVIINKSHSIREIGQRVSIQVTQALGYDLVGYQV